jgi:hypothetical protein
MLLCLLTAFCLVAYSLPWVITPGASLTLNAYDLAEWTGLNPAVRNGSVPLLPTLALRLLPVLVVVWFSQHTALPRWLRLCVTLVAAFALLPPLEFFTNGLSDLNFRQQFGLTIFTAATSGLIYLPTGERGRAAMRFAAIIVLVLLGGGGLIVSTTLLRAYQLSIQIGIGGVLLIGLAVIGGIMELKTNEVTRLKLPR